MSLFYFPPELKRELFLVGGHRLDKIAWIADALSQHPAVDRSTALYVTRNAVPDNTPERFEDVGGIVSLLASAAAALAMPVPPLTGWQTVH